MLRAAACIACVATALAAPSGWLREGRADPAKYVDLVIAIKHESPAAIEAALLRVSDPRSPDFGKHLTKVEVDALSRPLPGAVAAVKAWAASNGARNIRLSDARDFLFARATISTIEAMLGGSEYYVYTRGDARIIRTEASLNLPDSVRGFVDLVSPSTRFPPASTLRVKASGLKPNSGSVTPAVIRSQYGIGSTEAVNAKLQQAAAGFDGQWASTSDLASFYSKYYTPAIGRVLNIVSSGGVRSGLPKLRA